MRGAHAALWLLTGVAWAVSSLIQLAKPAYWEPVTPLDWVAVISYSVAWLTLAPSIVLVGRLVRSARVAVCSLVVAGGAVATGVANAVEDGLGVPGWGAIYVTAVLIATIAMVALAIAFASVGAGRLAAWCVGLVVALFLVVVGGGVGVFVLFALLVLRPLAVQPGPERAPAAV
jgi:hypothetical protein